MGRAARFGATLSLGYAQTDYFDTTSTTVLDSDTVDGSLRLRVEIDPRITGRAALTLSDLNRDGGTDVRRETFSVGAALAVTPVLDAEIDIGTTRVTQSGAVPRKVTVNRTESRGIGR